MSTKVSLGKRMLGNLDWYCHNIAALALIPGCAVQADKFHKTGKQLRSKMWWQNMRLKVAVVVIVLVLILVIFLLACFAPASHCIK